MTFCTGTATTGAQVMQGAQKRRTTTRGTTCTSTGCTSTGCTTTTGILTTGWQWQHLPQCLKMWASAWLANAMPITIANKNGNRTTSFLIFHLLVVAENTLDHTRPQSMIQLIRGCRAGPK